jgi:hypothetical protein
VATFSVTIALKGGGYTYTADTLPAPGDVITPDGTEWQVRVETVRGDDAAGAIFAELVEERAKR